jgi:hypothetical protein
VPITEILDLAGNSEKLYWTNARECYWKLEQALYNLANCRERSLALTCLEESAHRAVDCFLTNEKGAGDTGPFCEEIIGDRYWCKKRSLHYEVRRQCNNSYKIFAVDDETGAFETGFTHVDVLMFLKKGEWAYVGSVNDKTLGDSLAAIRNRLLVVGAWFKNKIGQHIQITERQEDRVSATYYETNKVKEIGFGSARHWIETGEWTPCLAPPKILLAVGLWFKSEGTRFKVHELTEDRVYVQEWETNDVKPVVLNEALTNLDNGTWVPCEAPNFKPRFLRKL